MTGFRKNYPFILYKEDSSGKKKRNYGKYKKFYRHYYKMGYRHLRAKGFQHDDIEDILSQTMEHAWVRFNDYTEQNQSKYWFYNILKKF